jgi:hypothetical protein
MAARHDDVSCLLAGAVKIRCGPAASGQACPPDGGDRPAREGDVTSVIIGPQMPATPTFGQRFDVLKTIATYRSEGRRCRNCQNLGQWMKVADDSLARAIDKKAETLMTRYMS